MASPLSLLLMSNNEYYCYYQHHQTPEHPTMTHLGSDSAIPEPISTPTPTTATTTTTTTTTTNRVKKPATRRNPSSSSSRKKNPQRGMGVAQLERLRAQAEAARKTQQPPLNLNQPAAATPVPVLDPIDSVPVQYGSVNYGVPVIGVPGWWGPDQGLVVKKPENVGYYELNNIINGGGFGPGHHHQVMGNRYNMVGAPVQFGNVTSAFETSKELTSMPKAMQQCSPTNCHACLKKKRFHGETKGQKGMKEKHIAEKSPAVLNCSDSFIRSNQGNYKTNNYNAGFSSIGSRTAFYGNHQSKEGTTTAEVVAVHRKGDSFSNSVVGRGVFMEYEFFPDHKNGKSSTTSTTTTCLKDQMEEEEEEFPAAEESSVAVMEFPAAASCITTTTTTSDHPYNTGYYNPYYNNNNNNNSYSASNSIDLSLKLSF